ncbi:MAG: hypothetical protein ACK5LL_03275 [Suipraeoptans sp.]
MANIIICDIESNYTKAFAQYFTKKKEFDIRIYACDTFEKVQSIASEVKIDFAFLSEELPYEDRQRLSAKKIFVFTEECRQAFNKDEIGLFKYQKMEDTLTIIMEHAELLVGESKLSKTLKKEKSCKVIGTFSPCSKRSSTSYAIQSGKAHAKTSSVLFLSTQSYLRYPEFASGEDDKTIVDLAYYYRQESDDLSGFISLCVKEIENMKYILPGKVSGDIRSIEANEWLEILNIIIRNCYYEIIILDLSESMQGLYEVLRVCHEVHIPYSADEFNQESVNAFEQELLLTGEKEILATLKRKGKRR